MSNRDRIPRTLNEAFGPHTSSLTEKAKSKSSVETKVLTALLVVMYVGTVVWCFL